jgi:hypothetical protein
LEFNEVPDKEADIAQKSSIIKGEFTIYSDEKGHTWGIFKQYQGDHFLFKQLFEEILWFRQIYDDLL